MRKPTNKKRLRTASEFLKVGALVEAILGGGLYLGSISDVLQNGRYK